MIQAQGDATRDLVDGGPGTDTCVFGPQDEVRNCETSVPTISSTPDSESVFEGGPGVQSVDGPGEGGAECPKHEDETSEEGNKEEGSTEEGETGDSTEEGETGDSTEEGEGSDPGGEVQPLLRRLLAQVPDGCEALEEAAEAP